MVLIFSGNANRSDQVPREVSLAEEERARVIPWRTENVRPSGDLQILKGEHGTNLAGSSDATVAYERICIAAARA
jgi:hypothetical protein